MRSLNKYKPLFEESDVIKDITDKLIKKAIAKFDSFIEEHPDNKIFSFRLDPYTTSILQNFHYDYSKPDRIRDSSGRLGFAADSKAMEAYSRFNETLKKYYADKEDFFVWESEGYPGGDSVGPSFPKSTHHSLFPYYLNISRKTPGVEDILDKTADKAVKYVKGIMSKYPKTKLRIDMSRFFVSLEKNIDNETREYTETLHKLQIKVEKATGGEFSNWSFHTRKDLELSDFKTINDSSGIHPEHFVTYWLFIGAK
jgi:hypothetical protein